MTDAARPARKRRAYNVPLLTAVVATVAVIGLLVVHFEVKRVSALDAVEGFTVDARFRLRGPRAPTTDKIVIVGLDDRTRREHPEVFQTRAGWATLIDALAAAKPKVIALDLFFSAPEILLSEPLTERVRAASAKLAALTAAPPDAPEPPEPADVRELRRLVTDVAGELDGDAKLAAAIQRAHRVVLGAFFQQASAGQTPAADAAAPPELATAAIGDDVATGGGGGARRPMVAASVETTLPALAHGAIGAAAVNDLRDLDGVARSMPAVIALGAHHYLSLGLAVALLELDRAGDTAYVVGDDHLTAAGRVLPLGDHASIALDVLGRDEIPRVSAAELLANPAAGAQLAGKLVFVGFTYAAYDKTPTALDPRADGIELHATLAENVLGGRLLDRTGTRAALLATGALCLIVALSQLRAIRRRAWVPPVITVAAIGGYLVIAELLFAHGVIVAIAAPVIAVGVVLLAATIGGLATEGREKAHLRAVFSQYVSQPVVEQILADPSRARLGGERKELSVLFSDIRGFSHISEGLPPEDLAALLGEYLTPMTDLVLGARGTLDKYIGDAVMAIFGAPVDLPDHAATACEVALRMQEGLAVLNVRWLAQGKPALAIGIGVNTGAMAVGNMGSAARFEYTVLGDEVNQASRLEGLTKEYGVQILVGAATARAAGAAFVFRELDLVRVKGRAAAAPVFELCGRAGTTTVAVAAFADALAAYRRREFAAAQAAFAAIADDHAAAVMAARCGELAAAPPDAAWDGVYDQRAK